MRNCVGYADPDIIAKAANEFVTQKNAQFLDFASGTGLIGDQLHEFGFTNFDGLDASKGMTDKCKQKGLYKNINNMLLGVGDLPDEFKEKYDVTVSAGSFIPSHLPAQTFT